MADDGQDEDLVAEALRRSEEWKRRDPDERAAAVGSLRGEVERAFGARNPELVDATDLLHWAERRDSATRFPELARRLVSVAPGLSRLTGRAGDGTSLPGWDLIAEANPGDAFVPQGISAWEFSVSSRPQQKAAHDLKKRTENALGLDPGKSTVVLVSLRRWPGKDEWAAKRTEDGPWREVRAYDADDIEAWLHLRPSVHYWLSFVLGRRPDAARSLDQWWGAWAGETDPALPVDLMLAGRAEHVAALEQWLESDEAVLTVQADARDEAAAFVASALLRTEKAAGGPALERALMVTDTAAWDQVISSDVALLLLPVGEIPPLGEAIERGHRVLVTAGPDVRGQGRIVRLSRLRRDEARDALVAAGVPERRASELALLARRSLMALRRRLGVAPAFRRPPWAEAPDGVRLAPVMLLGRWSGSKAGDQDALVAMAGRSYGEVQRDLARWSSSEDPPVRRLGHSWMVSSKEDLWLLLAPYLSAPDFDAFRRVFAEVLTEEDPALALEPERRHMASLFGHERNWSSDLREGVVDTVAFLGSRGEEDMPGGRTAEQEASALVESVLAWASADESGDRWASLGGLLPLLAEAAPDRFLGHVEAGLRGPDPLLRTIFRDSSSDGLFGDSSPHTGMLWALEGLCWEAEYLGRSAQALAGLAEIDPGGRLANRPAASLRDVFLAYQPHTSASLGLRLEVLDAIRGRNPQVAWALLRALLPSTHDWWSPTHAPRWRDWRPDDVPMATAAEIVTLCTDLVTRLVADAQDDCERWAQLVPEIADIPRPSREVLLEALRSMPARLQSREDQATVWAALDAFVAKHRRFPDAQWSLDTPEIDEVAAIRDLFHPPAEVERAAEVFGYFPTVPGIDERHGAEYEAALASARDEAVRRVLAADGLPGLIRLAEDAEVPEFIGAALVRLNDPSHFEPVVALLKEAAPVSKLAWGYVAAWSEAQGWESVSAELEAHESTWTPATKAELLLAVGVTEEALDRVASLGEQVSDLYWRRVSPYRVTRDLVSRVVLRLLEHDRPWSAVELLAHHAMVTQSSDEPLDTDVVATALEAAVFRESSEEPATSGLAHELGLLLDLLEDAHDERAARIEFPLLGLLQFQRPPRALHRQMATDPEFFADIVCRVYRADAATSDEGSAADDDEGSESDAAFAELAYTLLRSMHTVPGHRDDGSVDGEVLRAWFSETMRLLQETGRGQVANVVLGEVLAWAPPGEDGIWPCEAVRDIVDDTRSDDLDRGLHIGRSNSRGVTSRSPADGGTKERELAKEYRLWASQISARWPRTAGLLRGLAESYEQEARWHDESAERWMDHE
jgi:hypothetical protein